jgi:deoxyribodipyrimidine photo-lyase
VTELAQNRTTPLNSAAVRADGAYVLYWMIAHRRTRSNAALERAAGWARELNRPLLVFEPLRADYPWASARLHRFVLDGMADNARACAAHGVTHYPYVELEPGAGRGLLAALAADAAVVVTDDYPAFMLPRMVAAAVPQVPVRFEQVDGNGLLPMRLAGQAFATAYAFRRFVQRVLPEHVGIVPADEPLADLPETAAVIASRVRARWPAADSDLLAGRTGLQRLPLDHSVAPTASRGGSVAAHQTLARFLRDGLPAYAEGRNDLEHDVTSGLSPYLHFGHIGSHEVFQRVMLHEGWLGQLPRRGTGAREGWWGVGAAAEAFLDQLVTWRELGFNTCAHRPDYDEYASLPAWARATLERHADDPREHVYPLEAFEAAQTHDPLWNAAQTQLVREGRIHNYLRMLWGKKVLEWTASPQDALAVLIELNNKYALDGRDPNSYSGIFWTLGRYDRPWAPERPVFGTVRYMSSANTARKLRVKGYLQRFGTAPGAPQASLFA